MTEMELIQIAEKLVDITIKKHKQKLLGKENMSIFIKNNLNKNVTEEDYTKMLHIYNKYLAKKGYEINKDITKFDIINYNSEEYQAYLSK